MSSSSLPTAAPGVAWSEQLDAVAALIAEVASSYRVDPAAVVVTGFDTGAAGALALGGARPDLVGAVAVVSSVVEPLAGTELCGLRRVRFVHGRDDLISPLPVLRDWIGAFEERCGLDAELSVVAGGHFATVSEAYRDPDLYAWLTARPAG